MYIVDSYLLLIFTFVFCGVLRLCNLFPYAVKDMEACFPARRQVAGVYFAVLLLLPCVLHPQGADAQLLARCFWIIYIPVSAILAFRRFFHADRGRSGREFLLVGAVPAAALTVLSIFALADVDALQPYDGVIVASVRVVAVVLTVYLLCVTWWVWSMIRHWGG